jgi:hypothetical protein
MPNGRVRISTLKLYTDMSRQASQLSVRQKAVWAYQNASPNLSVATSRIAHNDRPLPHS